MVYAVSIAAALALAALVGAAAGAYLYRRFAAKATAALNAIEYK